LYRKNFNKFYHRHVKKDSASQIHALLFQSRPLNSCFKLARRAILIRVRNLKIFVGGVVFMKKLMLMALAFCLTVTGLQAMCCWCDAEEEEEAIPVGLDDRALVRRLLRSAHASELREKLLKKYRHGSTILMGASFSGFKDTVSYILRFAGLNGFLYEVLQARDRYGGTALMRAVNHMDVVRLIAQAMVTYVATTQHEKFNTQLLSLFPDVVQVIEMACLSGRGDISRFLYLLTCYTRLPAAKMYVGLQSGTEVEEIVVEDLRALGTRTHA